MVNVVRWSHTFISPCYIDWESSNLLGGSLLTLKNKTALLYFVLFHLIVLQTSRVNGIANYQRTWCSALDYISHQHWSGFHINAYIQKKGDTKCMFKGRLKVLTCRSPGGWSTIVGAVQINTPAPARCSSAGGRGAGPLNTPTPGRHCRECWCSPGQRHKERRRSARWNATEM